MTPRAKSSEYVTYEWVYAWGVGIRVVPILYKQTALHPRLESLQFLDFTNPHKRRWNKLLEELKLLNSGYIPPVLSKSRLDAGTLSLMEDLSAHDPLTRRRAIEALGNIGERNAVPKLIDILQSDDSWAARNDAAIALANIGDKTATRSLIRTLHADTSINVRAAAAWALGEFKSPEAVESLMQILERPGHQEERIKNAATVALRKISDKSIVPRLFKVIRYSSANVAARIIETLGEFGEAAAISLITDYVNNTTKIHLNEQTVTLGQVASQALERINLSQIGE